MQKSKKDIQLSGAQRAKVLMLYLASAINQLAIKADILKEDTGITSIHHLQAEAHNCFVIQPVSHKLRLKPVDALTPDELRELCQVACPSIYGNYRFKQWVVTFETDNEGNKYGATLTHEREKDYQYYISFNTCAVEVETLKDTVIPAFIDHQYWQWYYENAIAVPLYFADNEDANGLTAIELNVAIDITKPEKQD